MNAMEYCRNLKRLNFNLNEAQVLSHRIKGFQHLKGLPVSECYGFSSKYPRPLECISKVETLYIHQEIVIAGSFFDLVFVLTQPRQFYDVWPHLRHLKIECTNCSINLLLRILSANGIIEELMVTESIIDYKDE